MMLYRLDWGSYDSGSTSVLQGPDMTEEEWQLTLAKEIRQASEDILSLEPGYIGWGEVFEVLVARLKGLGFEEPPMRSFGAGGLPIFNRKYPKEMGKFLDSDLRERIFKHNEDINERHHPGLKKP